MSKNLTEQQTTIVKRLAGVDAVNVIASDLNLSLRTVETVRDRIYRRWRVHDRNALFLRAVAEGIVELSPQRKL